MPYNPTALGILVFSKPESARKELAGLFRTHGGLVAVSDHLEVDRHTVQRWINRLIRLGYEDPRQVEIAEKFDPAPKVRSGRVPAARSRRAK